MIKPEQVEFAETVFSYALSRLKKCKSSSDKTFRNFKQDSVHEQCIKFLQHMIDGLQAELDRQAEDK